MNCNKVDPISANKPFSWAEKKTGFDSNPTLQDFLDLKLPPPPNPSESYRFTLHPELQVPLPPCTFLPAQTPSRSFSMKGIIRKHPNLEDPFLAAYINCTQSNSTTAAGAKKGKWLKGKFWNRILDKYIVHHFLLSKRLLQKRENSVRVSELTYEQERDQ